MYKILNHTIHYDFSNAMIWILYVVTSMNEATKFDDGSAKLPMHTQVSIETCQWAGKHGKLIRYHLGDSLNPKAYYSETCL